MARTMTIKKGGGANYNEGWHTLTITKAKYGDWQGNKYLDMWFADYKDNFNLRVYAKEGTNGEEFAIGRVFRFANAGISEVLEGADGNMVVKVNDDAEELIDCQINAFFYKNDEGYSRILPIVAPTVFKNDLEEFTESDIEFWKSKAEQFYINFKKPKVDDPTDNPF